MKRSFRTRTICSAMALFLISGISHAESFNVTRYDDPIPNGCAANDCSLREAVIQANATAVTDTIVLGVGTYELLQAISGGSDELSFDLDITSDLAIIGQGADLTIVRNATGVANQHSRVFSIAQAEVSLSGLSVRDGSLYDEYTLPNVSVRGGCLNATEAVLNLRQVNLNNCRIDETGASGGAIYLRNSTATFVDVRMENNHIENGSGGAIALRYSSADFSNVVIDSNSAYAGGGIFTSGEVLLTGDNVQISNNTAHFGGAIYVAPNSGLLEQTAINWSTQSRIAQNTASGDGGALYVDYATILSIAPTADASVDRNDLLLIEGNHARGNGGGIYVKHYQNGAEPGTLDATRIALRLNTAAGSGGGVYSVGKIQMADSEIAGNTATSDGGGAALTGDATGNLIERTSFANNIASRGHGGAVSIAADDVKLVNVSTYSNYANGSGGGVAVMSGGSASLIHFTSSADRARYGGSLAVAFRGLARLRNSVLAAGCYKPPLSGIGLVNDGGNAQRSGQPACAGTAFSERQLALNYGYFGGRFDVVGIGAESLLRESASILGEARFDIRRWERVGKADAGAFEYDASD